MKRNFISFLIKNFLCLPPTKLASRPPSQRINSHFAFFRSVNRQLLIALHRCKVMKKYASPIWWMDGRWLWVCTLDNCIGFSVRKRDGKKTAFCAHDSRENCLRETWRMLSVIRFGWHEKKFALQIYFIIKFISLWVSVPPSRQWAVEMHTKRNWRSARLSKSIPGTGI